MAIDSHAHLTDEAFAEDIDRVIAEAESSGVDRIICVADDLDSSLKAIALSKKYKGISATVGVHPHHAQKVQDDFILTIRSLLKKEDVVAIGEIGLDYHYTFSSQEAQKRVLIEQLKVAKEVDLPVILHTREAEDDVLDILQEVYRSPIKGVMHSFWGSLPQAFRGLDMGLYIGVSGAVTFKNSSMLREIVRKIPLDRIVVETDAPYLAPVPYRGRRNEPQYVVKTVECIAELLELSVEKVEEMTIYNTQTLWDL